MVVSEVIKNFRPKIPPPRNPLPPGAGKNLSLEGHGAPPHGDLQVIQGYERFVKPFGLFR